MSIFLPCIAEPLLVPPTMVTDGLIFYVNAGNVSSYSGTGTTWYDISPTGAIGTLSGDVVYDASSKSMLFNSVSGTDGIAEFGYIPQLDIPTMTVQVWANPIGFGGLGFGRLVERRINGGDGWVFHLNQKTFSYGDQTVVLYSGNDGGAATGYANSIDFTVGLNAWQNFSVAYTAPNAAFYKNGNNNVTSYSNIPEPSTGSGTNFKIGNGYDGNGINYFNGRISVVLIYDRILTGAELQKNFYYFSGLYYS